MADVVEAFTDATALERFALYMFDFSAPVGMRIATRRPERVTGLLDTGHFATATHSAEIAELILSFAPIAAAEHASAQGRGAGPA